MRRGSVWLSMGVLWASYALIYTGYVWLRGYDIGFREIVAPVNFYQGTWPPPTFSGTGVFPTGGAGGSAAAGGSSTPSSSGSPSLPWWLQDPLNFFRTGID